MGSILMQDLASLVQCHRKFPITCCENALEWLSYVSSISVGTNNVLAGSDKPYKRKWKIYSALCCAKKIHCIDM
jgi:hypothetical protein